MRPPGGFRAEKSVSLADESGPSLPPVPTAWMRLHYRSTEVSYLRHLSPKELDSARITRLTQAVNAPIHRSTSGVVLETKLPECRADERPCTVRRNIRHPELTRTECPLRRWRSSRL